MSKHEKLIEYIGEYPLSPDWLYLNVVIENVTDGGVVLDAINVIEEYIDGSKRKEYVFNVEFCKDFSTNRDETNQTALTETNAFITWLENKESNEEYPDWEGVKFRSIEVLNEIPMLTIDSEHNRAIYTLQIKITYEE